jgi:hypothetical protein
VHIILLVESRTSESDQAAIRLSSASVAWASVEFYCLGYCTRTKRSSTALGRELVMSMLRGRVVLRRALATNAATNAGVAKTNPNKVCGVSGGWLNVAVV